MENVIHNLLKNYNLLRNLKDSNRQMLFLFLISVFNDGVLPTVKNELDSFWCADFFKRIKKDPLYFEIFQQIDLSQDLLLSDNVKDFIYSLGNINRSELGANFTEVFEDLLIKTLKSTETQHIGAITSPEICRLIMSIANLPENAKIFNPYAGFASLGIYLENSHSYIAEELVLSTCVIGKLRLSAHSKEDNFFIEQKNSRVNRIFSKEFDLITCIPPFHRWRNDKIKSLNGEYMLDSDSSFIIDRATFMLKNEGVAIIVVPESYLFGSSKNNRSQKHFLIDNNILDSVISLPPGLFSNTGVKTSIVVLRKRKDNDQSMKFFDLTDSYQNVNKYRILNLDESLKILNGEFPEKITEIQPIKIISNDYDLSVNRYLLEDFEGVKLSDLFQIEKGTTASVMETYPIVRVKDVLNASPYLDLSILSDIPSKKTPRFTLGQFLLVNTAGSKISAAVSKESQTIFFNPGLIQVLKLIDSEKVDLEYVYHIFHSEAVQKQIKGFTGGGSQAIRLRSKDLLNIKIPLPSIEEQKLYVVNQLRSVIQKEESALAKLKRESGIDDADDISYLRHSLAGSVKNIRDSFSKVLSILEDQVFNQNPELRLLTKTSRSKLTLQKHLEIISSDLEEVKNTLSRTSIEIDVRTMNRTAIDFVDFIKEYCNVLKANRANEFKVNFNYDTTLIENSSFKSIYINGDREMLRTALDNVVENAVKHAFISEENPLIEFELMFDFESDNLLQLDIANNGKCIPENFSIDDLTRKGQRVGKNAGDGFGGYLIREIIEAHGGSVDITDESGVEGFDYPRISTSFEITLPFTTNPEEYV